MTPPVPPLVVLTEPDGRLIHASDWSAKAGWDLPTRDGGGNWVAGDWRAIGPARNSAPSDFDVNLLLDALKAPPYGRLPEKGYVAWLAEADAPVRVMADLRLPRQARLLRQLETWNDRTLLAFAVDCAEHVLPQFENRVRADARVRGSIAVARQYVAGAVGEAELHAAAAAAGEAAAAALKTAPNPGASFQAASAASWPRRRDGTSEWAFQMALHAAGCATVAAWNATRAKYEGELAERGWQEQRFAELLGL